MLPTGFTVQSGCPGIGGVFCSYTQSRRNGATLGSVLTSVASAMKSSVLATTFLDDHASTTLVQSMAEQAESQP